jgi:anaerobic dimethyl sulfoxide reductase subunit C
MLQSKEWPLIVFTLLTQAGVGLFSILVFIREVLRSHLPENLENLFTQSTLIVILFFLSIGTATAASHLGQRFKAYRAIRNLSSSYLSREMLLGGLFGSMVGFLALLVFLEIGSRNFQTIVSFIGIIIGWGFVYAISKVYHIRTVPAWNSPATPISFSLATLLLGLVSGTFILLLASIQSGNNQNNFVEDFLQSASTVVTLLLIMQLVTFLFHIIRLSRGGRASLASVNTIFVDKRALFISRIVLTVFSLIPLLAIIGKGIDYSETTLLSLVTGATMILVWSAELIGRFLFYESHHRIGL